MTTTSEWVGQPQSVEHTSTPSGVDVDPPSRDIHEVDVTCYDEPPPGILAIPAAFLSPTALTLPPDSPPSREALLGLLATCGTVSDASHWWRGDCYLYAERHYGIDWLSSALEPEDFERLKPYIWCSERVLPEHRRCSLSWSHHRAVAGKDAEGQVYWLDQAEAEGWTVRQLRAAMRNGAPSQKRVKRDWPAALALSAQTVGERWTQAHHDSLAQLLGG